MARKSEQPRIHGRLGSGARCSPLDWSPKVAEYQYIMKLYEVIKISFARPTWTRINKKLSAELIMKCLSGFFKYGHGHRLDRHLLKSHLYAQDEQARIAAGTSHTLAVKA